MATAEISESDTRLEPVGVEGCPTCAALIESRQVARDVGEASAVARCNREISYHPHRMQGGEMRVWGVVQ